MFPPLSKHQSKNKTPPPTQFELHLSWEHTCVLNDLQAIDLPPFINDSSGKYTKKPSGKTYLLFLGGNTGKTDKNIELNQTNPAPVTSVQLHHEKGQV